MRGGTGMTTDIRWLLYEVTDTEPERRGGSIVYGGKCRQVTRTERKLQVRVNDVWRDVPEVKGNG